ncbi:MULTISPECIES: lipopolysaccharide biosynthesis protein [unclassified Paenarthrobacter]|uniref:lipopolysaccharide biosynthesis protein n=1 Tax=unclassified Paenarthrobacter TaxID=2634190 RepID=UPI003CF25DE3
MGTEGRTGGAPPAAKIARSSGVLAVSAGVVGVLSYACTLLMATMLSTADYTRFAAAAMMLGMVGIVASALVPLPLSHVVAVHPAGSLERRDGMAFSVFVSGLAGVAAALVTGTITLALGSPSLAGAVALGSMAIFAVTAPAGWLQGELRFSWYAVTNVGEVLARFLFSLLVVALAWGAGGAVLGFAVGSVVPLVVPASFYRDLQWRPSVLRERGRWAETGDIASVLCVVSVLVGLDVVVVGFLDGGSVPAAGFQALATIAKGPVYVAAGTALVAFPLLRTPGADIRQVLTDAFTSFGELAVVAFSIIATAPHTVAGIIIPAKYHGSLASLPWLAAAGLGYAVIMVLSTILLALGAYRRCQLGLVFATALILAALWGGWQLQGVAGLTIGSALGSVAAALVLAAMARPVMNGRSGKRNRARPLCLAVAVVAALAAAAWLHPVVWLILAAAVGAAALIRQRGQGAPRPASAAAHQRHAGGRP